MMATFTLAPLETTSLKVHCRGDSIKLFSVTAGNCGVSPPILKTNFSQQPVMTKISQCGDVINLFGHQPWVAFNHCNYIKPSKSFQNYFRSATSASRSASIHSEALLLLAAVKVIWLSWMPKQDQQCWPCVFAVRLWIVSSTIRLVIWLPLDLRTVKQEIRKSQIVLMIHFSSSQDQFTCSEYLATASLTSAWTRFVERSRWRTSTGVWIRSTCRRPPSTSTCCSGMSKHLQPSAARLRWKTSSGWPTTAQSDSWSVACGATATTRHRTLSSRPILEPVDMTWLLAVMPRDTCDCSAILASPHEPSLQRQRCTRVPSHALASCTEWEAWWPLEAPMLRLWFGSLLVSALIQFIFGPIQTIVWNFRWIAIVAAVAPCFNDKRDEHIECWQSWPKTVDEQPFGKWSGIGGCFGRSIEMGE